MKIFKRTLPIFALLPLLFGSVGCQNYQNPPSTVDTATSEVMSPQLRIQAISPQSQDDLRRCFFDYQYSWKTLNHGVPPLIVEKFPDDYYKLAAGSERTKTFFLTLLPMILLVNEEIATERKLLVELFSRFDRNELLSSDEVEQIALSAHNYRVAKDPLTNRQARILLLNRLDQIPPSLALAQAASESAYGTSRFSRLGNNLFGEMVFKKSSEGILPLNRLAGAKHRARIFPTLLDSLRAYIFNLNTHPAYQELRQIRAEMQMRGEKARGMELARGLLLYSTRKEAYINDIRAIIRGHNLPKLTANIALRKEVFGQEEQTQRSLPLPTEIITPQASTSYFYGRDLLSQN